ncbi:ABC transporter permease subunit [Clostridium sp. CCUG 7971]|uniref:ABC transporter permease n=1 Tax=Clostridium sp. CCUG 7971 TaxID=2811414 RepID=UPI001ABB7296|nr:ABC transporter permease subunit [Clostridium sp. CCUG 7971]MBO3443825.1 ABC transporter permease subunit [Clostridium sp. CCUG 7971]
MLDLIKFELYKIFSKKSVIIVLLLTVLFSIFNVVGQDVYLKFKGLDSIDDAYTVMEKYEGKVITQEYISNTDKTVENLTQKEKSGKELTKEELVHLHFSYDNPLHVESTYIINNNFYSLNEIKDEISNLEKENKKDTYEYKNLNYVYGKAKNIEKPKFYFSHGWNTTTSFKIIGTLIAVLIVAALATTFSDEYQSNSAQIILSCKNGKNKLVLSKLLSGLIFTVIVFLIINIIYFMSALRYDFIGWDKPLALFKYYGSTIFDIRIIDFYIRGLGISFIGSILFALVTMLISLLFKNNIISLLLSLGIYSAPAFLGGIIPIEKVAKVFKEINLAEATKVESMFTLPNTYNIFGNPVLYSTLLISLVVIAIPVVIYLIKYFGKKQTI